MSCKTSVILGLDRIVKGEARLSVSDFLVEVAKGNIPGHSVVQKFGHAVVGTGLTPITHSGFYRTPLAPVSLEFLSDDPNDTALGTGAREITFTGIDINHDEAIFSIATDGTTPVALPTDLKRLYRWKVSASGSYATALSGSHGGTLTVRVAGAGETWSTIDPTPFAMGQSEIGAFTVPNGLRALIVQQEFHVDSTKSVDIILFKRTGIDTVVAPFTAMTALSRYVGVSGNNPTDFKIPLDTLPAKTDFGYMGIVSAQTADISVHFAILLIEDGF